MLQRYDCGVSDERKAQRAGSLYTERRERCMSCPLRVRVEYTYRAPLAKPLMMIVSPAGTGTRCPPVVVKAVP
jgi:hypothetical protein